MIFKTTPNTIPVTIGVTPTEVLPPNPKRKAILLSPIPAAAGKANAISLSHRSDVVVGEGTLNFLQGQYAEMLITDEYIGTGVTQPWFAVCAAANTTFQITEYIYDD